MDWNEHIGKHFFITDLGLTPGPDPGTGLTPGRYAVWAPVTNTKNHQIVEVSGDLEALVEKYKVSRERVCTLAAQKK